MFRVREALADDLDDVLEVARGLNTVNLPADRDELAGMIELSVRSFGGEPSVDRRVYLLVLEDLEARRVVATSMIHAQHGRRSAPHVYLDVLEEERYSETLDRHFVHKLLRLGFNYSGPTEIGGLAVLPAYRGRPEKLGLVVGYARFLLIAMHRAWFRDEVLSELMPPIEPDGTSLLWEALGRRFTGLSYREADRISARNKEFVRSLFPSFPINAALLPDEAQALIGVVGPQARGVEKMLHRAGFRYANRIDPFDGGPHFVARTDEIPLVRAATRRRLAVDDSADRGGPRALLAAERSEPPRFLACAAPFALDGDAIRVPEAARALLGARAGEEVWTAPLDGRW